MAFFGELQEQCDDCSGVRNDGEPFLTYQVVETKRLCNVCAEKRGSKVLDRDFPSEKAGTLPAGKTLSLKCRHCAIGMCARCEEAVTRELQRLALKESTPITDIKDKASLRIFKEIELPDHIASVRMCGLVGTDRLAIVDASDGCLYLLNIESGEVVTVINSSEKMAVTDCTIANRKELVVSNLADGGLYLHNETGKQLCELPLPGKAEMKKVFVATATDGDIVATRRGEKGIFIMNALTERHTSTIPIQGAASSSSRGLQVMPSGRILLEKEWAEFLIVGGVGAVRSTQQWSITDPIWFQAECGLHPSRDLLYVLYSRRGADPETIHLDEVTFKGEIRRKSLLKFKIRGPLCRPIITPRMELVVCNGRSITIYK